jgi:hypothetical protein
LGISLTLLFFDVDKGWGDTQKYRLEYGAEKGEKDGYQCVEYE